MALLAPAEKENTPPVEADLETAGGAPNTDSFLAPALPEKLKAPDPEPGSVADFPKAKMLAGFSAATAVLLLLLKEKAAAVPELVVAVEPPKLKVGAEAEALKEAAFVSWGAGAGSPNPPEAAVVVLTAAPKAGVVEAEEAPPPTLPKLNSPAVAEEVVVTVAWAVCVTEEELVPKAKRFC